MRDDPVTPAQSAPPAPVQPLAGSWLLTRADELGALRRVVSELVDERGGGDHGADESAVRDRVVLAVNELATNALKYGAEPITVMLSRHGESWLISVQDAGSQTPPAIYSPEPGRIGGHGLVVVHKLSTAWGWHRLEDDPRFKRIWATIPDAAPPVTRHG